MREDADHRVALILVDLMRLRHMLPPEDFADLLGAVSVEIETGLELVTERSMTRRTNGNVVPFTRETISGPK